MGETHDCLRTPSVFFTSVKAVMGQLASIQEMSSANLWPPTGSPMDQMERLLPGLVTNPASILLTFYNQGLALKSLFSQALNPGWRQLLSTASVTNLTVSLYLWQRTRQSSEPLKVHFSAQTAHLGSENETRSCGVEQKKIVSPQ